MSLYSLRSLICTPLVAVSLVLSGQAVADAVTTDAGIRVDNVFIESVKDGELVYRAPGGMQSRALAKIRMIEVNDLEELTQGQKAVAEEKWREAVGPLTQALRKANQDWQRQFIAYNLVQAHNALGNAGEAVSGYIRLAQTKADPFFLGKAPIDAVKAAPASAHDALRRELMAGRRGAPEAALKSIEQMLEIVKAPDQPATPGDGGTTPGDGTTSNPDGDATSPTPRPTNDSKVTLPRGIPEDLEIVKALQAGKFEDAINLGKGMVNSTDNLARNLYLLGMAQLGIAEASGKDEDYLTAGVTFMHVVAYFRRMGSPVVGAAMVEAGYVHQKIGRGDVAAKLFRSASPLLAEDEQPEYAQRLDQLRTGDDAEDPGAIEEADTDNAEE